MIVLDPWSSHAEFDSGNDEHLLRKQLMSIVESKVRCKPLAITALAEKSKSVGKLYSPSNSIHHPGLSPHSLWVSL